MKNNENEILLEIKIGVNKHCRTLEHFTDGQVYNKMKILKKKIKIGLMKIAIYATRVVYEEHDMRSSV